MPFSTLLAPAHALGQSCLNHPLQLLLIERFLQEVDGATAHGRHRTTKIVTATEKHQRDQQLALAHLLLQPQATGAGHLQVDHRRPAVTIHLSQKLVRAGEGSHPIAATR